MRQLDKRRKILGIFLYALGFALSIFPPIACTLLYFPVWREEGGALALSGICALLIAISLIPIYKWLRQRLHSPAAYTVWLILFIVFFLLSRIAHEMTVISFAGFVGNLLGALCFKLSRGGKANE